MIPADLSPEQIAEARALYDAGVPYHAIGARFVIVPFTCPGAEAAGVRKDPAYLRWINDLLAAIVDKINDSGGDARLLPVPPTVCIGGDPLAEPTDAKRMATADEVHVADWAGGAWIWNEWLAPALTDLQRTS